MYRFILGVVHNHRCVLPAHIEVAGNGNVPLIAEWKESFVSHECAHLECPLSQDCRHCWQSVAFMSQTMNTVQCNYSVYECSVLAVVEVIKAW
jgi:hypothetical protein